VICKPCLPACLAVVLTGEGAESVLGKGELVFLSSDHPEDENSFDTPTKVCTWSFMPALCPWAYDVC
jgi:hypothetical protein